MKFRMAYMNYIVVIAIILITVFIFILGLFTSPLLNEEFLYIIPILLTLWAPGKNSTLITSTVSIALAFLDYYFLSIFNHDLLNEIFNADRIYAVIGVLVTTYTVLKNKEKEKTIERNVKELNKLIEKLKISNADLEQYAYVASHDLQEPLRNITNYIGLLEKRMDGGIDKETGHFLNRIVNSSEKLKTLIQEILLYSLIGKNRVIENVDCEKVLADVLAGEGSLIRESGGKIIADKLPVIESNPTEMKQLFQNLINNAIKYRKKNTPPEIHIHCGDKITKWLFSIEDNGIGIEKEHFNKIFQVFQRLHSENEYPGTGIGLAICKKITQMNMGEIWVESTPGIGSTFYFTIAKNQTLTA